MHLDEETTVSAKCTWVHTYIAGTETRAEGKEEMNVSWLVGSTPSFKEKDEKRKVEDEKGEGWEG